MCKACELRGINMALNPLDLIDIERHITLPKSWTELMAKGFHPDLHMRACAHIAWTERKAKESRSDEARMTGNARAFVSAMAKGFMEPFDRTAFEPTADDPYIDLKLKALDAIQELSDTFGDRVSAVMWDSLAHLGTRSEPEQNRSILKEADTLPHHYGIVDAMLHAMGKVYTFSLGVQSVFYRHTGMVLIHNCDCGCSLLNLRKASGAIEFVLSRDDVFEATQSLWSHMLAESHLILNERLPFEYTITGDGIAVLGMEAENKH